MPTSNRKPLKHLPMPEDGIEGLQVLIDAFGEEETLKFLLWTRDPHAQKTVFSPFRGKIAVDLVREHPLAETDFGKARAEVSRELGITRKGLPNFIRCTKDGLAYEEQAAQS